MTIDEARTLIDDTTDSRAKRLFDAINTVAIEPPDSKEPPPDAEHLCVDFEAFERERAAGLVREAARVLLNASDIFVFQALGADLQVLHAARIGEENARLRGKRSGGVWGDLTAEQTRAFFANLNLSNTRRAHNHAQWIIAEMQAQNVQVFGIDWTELFKNLDNMDALYSARQALELSGATPQSITARPVAKKGASLKDAAKIINNDGGDPQTASERAARWRDAQAFRALISLGKDPSDKREKLFECTALCDFIENHDGYLPMDKQLLLKRLNEIARNPLQNS